MATWPLGHSDLAFAEIPRLVNYQGRLTENSGTAVQGPVTFTFRLYDAASAGSQLWSENNTVTLTEADNGVFNVILGGTTPMTSIDFNQPIWLSVQIEGDSEMTPRQRMTAVGYALNADKLDSLDSTSFMRTDVDTSTSGKLTITRAGAAFLIKPVTNPTTGTKMIDVQNAAGTSQFNVTSEGDVSITGNLSVSGSIAGSTTITGTTNTSWDIGSATDATANSISLLFGKTSGQESLVFDGASTKDFILSDDLRLDGQSALRLVAASGSNYVGLRAPSTVGSSVTWTLPSTDGSSGQVLTTNGSGALSWANDANAGGTITGVTAGTGLTGGGTSGTVTLALSTPVSVANGGTGASSLASYGVLYGGGTGAVGATSAGSSNTVLHGNTGAAPAFSAVSLTGDVSGVLPLANGGTNASLSNCTSGQALTVTGGAVACTSTITASTAAANSLDFTEFKNTMALDADTTIGLGSYNLIISGTKSTNVLQLQNAQSSAKTAKFYVEDTATAGASHLQITPSDGEIHLNADVVIDSANYNQNPAHGGLFIAQDPTASNSDGYIFLGRKSAETGGWGMLKGGSNGKLTWNGSELEIEGDSPAAITFGTGANTQRMIFDATSGGTSAFSFTGGTFAQQFRNLVKNGSFEAFSQLEVFATVSGGTGGQGTTYRGGWDNFSPDEWLWKAGKVYQNAPMLFSPTGSITAATLQNEYYHGKSSVTIEDGSASSNTYNDTTTTYGSEVDGHIQQVISGLKPNTVYAVGAYMRRVNATAEAIVDVAGEQVSTTASLTASMTSTDSKMTLNSIASFPDVGEVLVDSERISYTGKDTSASQLTQLLRGFEGTTAAAHSNAAAVVIAPFKHLTTAGSSTPDVFTLYKGQFVTTATADDVTLHLFCKGSATDQCRFDGVQIVEGRSVPEFSPSAIVDTGDQTLYGSLRMGRTSDGRGGILSIDKALRSRSIEFFDRDPGMSGTAGGFGGVGPATKVASAATSTTTLTTGGQFNGSIPREMQISVTALSPAKFKWDYRECFPTTGCTGAFVNGASNLDVSSYTSLTVLSGSMGVQIAFANSGTITTTDQWTFQVSGANMSQQYSSYSSTATYQPGNTRIFKDSTNQKLTFQDGSTIVTLDQIPGTNIGSPARVDYPQFFPASAGGGQMYLTTSQGYTGPATPSPVMFDVQICANGTGGTRDSYQWRDNLINGGNVAAADWDISCTQIPASGGPTSALTIGAPDNINYGITLTFGSPVGTWQDGNIGDRWQVKAYAAGAGCADGQVLKWTAATSKWACQADLTGAGGTITAVGDITNGAAFTSGVPGQTLTFKNATSGTVTLQTVPGALGAVTASLPAATGTVVLDTATQTLTNKTLTASGLITANGGVTLPDGQVLDLSAINPNTTTEGLKLPQATVCTGATAEGQVCWKTDTDDLYLGTGAGVKQLSTGGTVTSVGAGTGISTGGSAITTSGTVSLDYSSTLASALAAKQTIFDNTDSGGGLLFEGATANAFQTLLTVIDPTADRTLSLPNATTTLVGTDTTDTLTNKTLTAPVLTTPTLGVATATTINKVTLTAPASGSTLTIADGKTLTANNSLTLAGVDGKTLTVNNSLTLAGTDGTTMTFPGTSDTIVTLAATQTLTNKTIGSTGLTFSGAATDITTSTNEHLAIMPNGTGNVGIGTTNPQAKLHVAGGGLAVDADQKLSLKGADATADSYMQFDSTNNRIRFYINAVEVARLKN